MNEDRGIPRIEDVADALGRDKHTLRVERSVRGFLLSDDTQPVGLSGLNVLWSVLLPQRVIDAIKERC